MRRVIFSTSKIYGMSLPRKEAADKIRSVGPAMEEHLCKCVIYGDTLHCLDHWIKELASFLDAANNCILKGNKKFTASQYADMLFGAFGDSKADIQNSLRYFATTDMGDGKDYPDITLTPDMVDTLAYVVWKFREDICEILATRNMYKASNFVPFVRRILEDAGVM